MKLTLGTILIAVAGLVLPGTASALSITPTTGALSVTRWQGNEHTPPTIATAIAPYIGGATQQYKNNVGGAEEGALQASYNGTFGPSNADAGYGTISYVSGSIVSPTAFFLVKDGNHQPAWYLYNLTALGWTGVESLELSGFWPNQGSISHVAIYGGIGTSVPDSGTTVGLLGLGLLGFALIGRRFLALA